MMTNYYYYYYYYYYYRWKLTGGGGTVERGEAESSPAGVVTGIRASVDERVEGTTEPSGSAVGADRAPAENCPGRRDQTLQRTAQVKHNSVLNSTACTLILSMSAVFGGGSNPSLN